GFGDGTVSGNRANISYYNTGGIDNGPAAARTDGTAPDINGDRIPDVVFGNFYDAQICIGLGRGDGTFSQHFYSAAYSPDIGTGIVGKTEPTYLINVADYNRDGVMDVM